MIQNIYDFAAILFVYSCTASFLIQDGGNVRKVSPLPPSRIKNQRRFIDFSLTWFLYREKNYKWSWPITARVSRRTRELRSSQRQLAVVNFNLIDRRSSCLNLVCVDWLKMIQGSSKVCFSVLENYLDCRTFERDCSQDCYCKISTFHKSALPGIMRPCFWQIWLSYPFLQGPVSAGV